MSSAPDARITPEPTPIRPPIGREQPASLSVPLTSFVGRERETDAVVALLADPHKRLVTLVGPGGVGKTRLASRVVARFGRGSPGAVWCGPTASVHDPEIVAGAIAQVVSP